MSGLKILRAKRPFRAQTHAMSRSSIRPGDQAPDFELEAASGGKVRLSDFRGKKNVVLFFYPKDETAGCTVEACTFRDSYEDFLGAGAEVIGVSGDSLASHNQFADRHRLPFVLLSDPGGKVAALYDVRKALGLIPDRVTFLIDREGVVRHVTGGRLRFKQHVTESLAILKGMSPGEASLR
jgi:peroxiredoxin Q/BCP